MSQRILITPRSLTQGLSPDLQPLEKAGYKLVYAPAGKTPTEGDLLELVPGCVGWLAGVEAISERVLRAATDLKAISRNGTGVDNVPAGLAQRLGIKVVTGEAADARGVAELAICLALASLRQAGPMEAYPGQRDSRSTLWSGRVWRHRPDCGAISVWTWRAGYRI